MWWKVEKCWLNSETVMVEPWNSDSGTVSVGQCGWNSVSEQFWWNRWTVMLEQWKSDGETVWWNSGTVVVQ